MAYIARADLEIRFGQEALGQVAYRDALDIDDVVAAAIGAASELIDGYLAGGGYTLPLVPAPAPALLAEIALDVVWYKLWRNVIPEDVTQRYRDAIRQLESIQSGRIALQVGGSEIDPTDSDSEVLFDSPERPFNSHSMGGF